MCECKCGGWLRRKVRRAVWCVTCCGVWMIRGVIVDGCLCVVVGVALRREPGKLVVRERATRDAFDFKFMQIALQPCLSTACRRALSATQVSIFWAERPYHSVQLAAVQVRQRSGWVASTVVKRCNCIKKSSS